MPGRRTRLFLLAGSALAALAAGGAVVALYFYASGRDDRIARGVRVAGVDVGGLEAPAATRRVRARLARRYQRPLVLAHGRRRFRISPRQVGLRAVVAPAVARALARSRAGSFLSRGWRELRGHRLRLDLPVRIAFSRAAVRRVVDGVARTLARTPKDAQVRTSAVSISFTPGHDGLEVLEAPLRRALAARLLDPRASRTIEIPTRTLRPRVTNAELHRRYGTFVGVSREEFELRLFKDFRLVKTYTVSIGRVGYETPAGLYHVRSKVVNPNWIVPDESWAGSLRGRVIPGGSPQNPIKARWLGFYGGAGVHGTDDVGSLGHAASHGCVRMSIPDVEDLYERVPLGAPIYIG